MPTRSSLPYIDHSDNSGVVCRNCGQPLKSVRSESDSPGSGESDWFTLSGLDWCNSADGLTFEEWQRQPKPTFEQYMSGTFSFVPYRYHEPISHELAA